MLGSSWDDPRTLATLAAAQQLLSGSGSSIQRIADAGMSYGGTLEQRKSVETERQRRMAETLLMQQRVQQMVAEQKAAEEQSRRMAGIEGAYRSAIETPAQQALAAGGGPTVQNAQAMEGLTPRLNQGKLISGLMNVDPLSAAKLLQPGEQKIVGSPKDGLWDITDPQNPRQIIKPLPSPENNPAEWRLYELSGAKERGLTFDQWDQARRQSGATKIVNMTGGQKGFDNEMKLRSDFKSEPIYKEFQDTQSAYKQIKQALKQGTPIGDTAAATKIMKLLDPGSVVRESELAMAMQATGKWDRLRNYVQMQISGNKLTPQQRVEFGELADEFYGAAEQAFNAKRVEYEKLGSEYGLNAVRALGPAPKKEVDFNDLPAR